MTDEGVTAILKAIAELANTNAELIKGQAELTKGLAELTKGQAELTKGQAELTRHLAELRAEMKAELAAVKLDVTDLRAELHGTRAEIMARIDRLQNSFSDVKDDITVNYGAASQSDRIARSALEQVQGMSEMMAAMQRQIRRLSSQVFGPDDLH